MKTTSRLIGLILLLIMAACSKEDHIPQPQQQQVEPTPEPDPEPENQPPGSFSVNAEVSKNTALLDWSAAVDPDGDKITYTVMLGDSILGQQTTTGLDITGLIFEKEYTGKIIADDGNEHQVETTFNFTTGFLLLAVYEGDNGSGNFYSYEYDDNGLLSSTTVQPQDEHSYISYDANGQVFSIGDITYNHNTNGLLTSISDGTGLGDLEFLYDDQDRVREMRVTRMKPSNNTVGNVKILYTYNALGNLTLLDVNGSYTSTDPNSPVIKSYNKRRLSYDNNGNVVAHIIERSDDGITYIEKFKETFTYDDKKNPWSSIISRQFKFSVTMLYGLQYEFHPPIIIGLELEKYSMRLYRGPHNVTNHKLYLDGNLNTEYTFEYTYNATGYPITAKWSTGSQEYFPRWTYNDSE